MMSISLWRITAVQEQQGGVDVVGVVDGYRGGQGLDGSEDSVTRRRQQRFRRVPPRHKSGSGHLAIVLLATVTGFTCT